MIQSLQRALGILEFVAKIGTGVSMAAVSRNIGLHPSTTYHLVHTLTALGYLAQDGTTREYRVGSKVFQLAASAWGEIQLVKISASFLAEAAQQTGETSHLAIFEHGEVIVVDKVEGSSPIRVSERVGYPRPAHCTAIGKALLASLMETELNAFLEKKELRPYTPRTIISRELLEQELARVRDQGYALDDEEFTQGVRCVAVPLCNFTGHVVAAIGVSGPVAQVSLGRVADLAVCMKSIAHRLSRQLGYVEDPVRDGNSGAIMRVRKAHV